MSATTDDDLKAIKKLGIEYFEAANAGDADWCLAVMAPDVIIMPPDSPSLAGTEEIGRLTRGYHAKYELKYTVVYDEVETAGNLGFARATVTGTRTSKLPRG